MLVPASDDPKVKLMQAYELLAHGRPLPAERLIRESLVAFESAGDGVALANAYRAYGYFFASSAVGSMRGHYHRSGFLDPAAVYEARYRKSIEYLEKAAALYSTHARYDGLTNSYFQIGNAQLAIGDRRAACAAYDKSLDFSRDHHLHEPDVRVGLPRGFSTYKDFISSRMAQVRCATLEAGSPSPVASGSLAAPDGSSATLTVKADGVRLSWGQHFGFSANAQPRTHRVELSRNTEAIAKVGIPMTKLAELRSKSPFNEEVASVDLQLPAGTPLLLMLEAERRAGQSNSRCSMPFSLSLEPNGRYLIEIPNDLTCDPRFYVLGVEGKRQEFEVRRTW
jgi:tetratricopeptide (TPR) repeat protein